MGMDGMVDILFFASGIYLIYTIVKAKKHSVITASVMMAKNTQEMDLPDKAGYIDYMYKKVILAGVMICAGAVIHLVNDFYFHLQPLVWVGILLIAAALMIYIIAFSRGQKKYMSQQGKQNKTDKKK